MKMNDFGMITYEKIVNAAMEQSAIDLSCAPGDFRAEENRLVISRRNENARKYLELPFFCQFVSYGNNVVASASEKFAPFAEEYMEKYGAVRCFETPAMLELDRELQKHGHRVCFMAQYYLPVPELIKLLDCGPELRVMEKPDFEKYYLP